MVAGPDLDARFGTSDGDERPRRLLIAQPVLDFSELAAAGAALDALRGFADELALDERGVRMRVTGDVALSYEEMTLVERQAAMAGVASFVMVTLLLTVALRSLRFVMAIVASLLTGLIATAGFAALAIGHLNLISVAFAVLFIGLAADFSLHLCLRYQELLAAGTSRLHALEETARGVGTSLVLCAATTAIGFFAFVPTDFAGVAELGAIAGAGMGIGLVTTFTIVPAVLSLGAEPRGAKGLGATASLPTLPLRYPRGVATAAAVVTLGAFALVPEVEFDQNPLRVRDPSAESVQAYEELLEQGRTSPWGMAAVAPDLATAEALAERLRALEVVEDAQTVADFIPGEQDEKLAILEDAALFLAPPPTSDGSEQPPGVEEQLAALREFDGELARLERDDEGVVGLALLETARRLRAALRDFTQAAATASTPEAAGELVDSLEVSLVGSLPNQLETLERLLSAERITFDDLPQGLRDRMVSAGGRVRVDIHPVEDLNDGEALARFVDGVRAVAPDATGNAVNIHEASLAVVSALREALFAAVVVIGLLLFLIWRTVGDTLLVMAPLLLAGLLTSASAVLLDIPFNFADIIVLPLLLGIGVDSGIHLVHRARMRDTERDRLLETSTARAVVFQLAHDDRELRQPRVFDPPRHGDARAAAHAGRRDDGGLQPGGASRLDRALGPSARPPPELLKTSCFRGVARLDEARMALLPHPERFVGRLPTQFGPPRRIRDGRETFRRQAGGLARARRRDVRARRAVVRDAPRRPAAADRPAVHAGRGLRVRSPHGKADVERGSRRAARAALLRDRQHGAAAIRCADGRRTRGSACQRWPRDRLADLRAARADDVHRRERFLQPARRQPRVAHRDRDVSHARFARQVLAAALAELPRRIRFPAVAARSLHRGAGPSNSEVPAHLPHAGPPARFVVDRDGGRAVGREATS